MYVIEKNDIFLALSFRMNNKLLTNSHLVYNLDYVAIFLFYFVI